MNSHEWDERYAANDSVWGAAPNRWVEQETADLPPGRALDLACGEGRNAAWLAGRGWDVTAVDFSSVAIDKGRAGADDDGRITWIVADVTEWTPMQRFDLVLVVYLHLTEIERRRVLETAVSSLAARGHLLVVAHDASNIDHGVGGPQDPAVLPTADDVVASLAGLQVLRAGSVEREVAGEPRPAIDLLVHAMRA